MPKKKRSGATTAKPKRRERANALDMKDLREFLDEVHEITDKMETSNARARQNIGKVYERASAALSLTKKAVAGVFRKERQQLKEEMRAQEKGTAEDRDSYLRLATAYGDDSPLGQWAMKVAAQIVDGEEGEDEPETSPAHRAAHVATVTPLRQPG